MSFTNEPSWNFCWIPQVPEGLELSRRGPFLPPGKPTDHTEETVMQKLTFKKDEADIKPYKIQ